MLSYNAVPGFVIIVGGVLASLSMCFRRPAIWIVTLLSAIFVLGLAPDGGEWPVNIGYDVYHKHVAALVVLLMLGLLADASCKLNAVSVVFLFTASGAVELSLLNSQSHSAYLLAELVPIVVACLAYQFDRKYAAYLTALGSASMVFFTTSDAMNVNSLLLNPAFLILGHKVNLSAIGMLFGLLAVAARCFAPPLSCLLSNVYRNEWPSEPVKGFVFGALCIGSTFNIIEHVNMKHFIVEYAGWVIAISCGFFAILNKTKRGTLSYNMIGNAGLALMLVGRGQLEMALLQFMFFSITHVALVYIVDLSMQNLPDKIILFVAVLPMLYMPPFASAALLREWSGGLNHIETTFLFLWLAMNAMVVIRAISNLPTGNVVRPSSLRYLLCGTITVSLLANPLVKFFSKGVMAAKSAILVPEFTWMAMAASILAYVAFYVFSMLAPYIRDKMAAFGRKKQIVASDGFHHRSIDLQNTCAIHYLEVGARKFFFSGCTIVFDYVADLVYTTRQFDGVRCMTDTSGACAGSSGFVSQFALGVAAICLWAFLCARYVL